MIANLVDVLPAWLEDWFVPLFLPHSTLRIPINEEIPLKLPGKHPIPLPASIIIKDASLNHLNEFTVLKPAKLMPGTKFTWDSNIALKETRITLDAGMKVLGHDINVSLALTPK